MELEGFKVVFKVKHPISNDVMSEDVSLYYPELKKYGSIWSSSKKHGSAFLIMECGVHCMTHEQRKMLVCDIVEGNFPSCIQIDYETTFDRNKELLSKLLEFDRYDATDVVAFRKAFRNQLFDSLRYKKC